MNVRKNSIRWRIQRWYGLLLISISSIMAVGFFFYEKASRKEKVGAELSYLVSALIPRLVPSGGPRGPRTEGQRPARRPPRDNDLGDSQRLPRGRFGPGFDQTQNGFRNLDEVLEDPDIYYVVWDSEQQPIRKSDNVPTNISYPPENLPLAETLVRTFDGNMEAVHFVPNQSKMVVGIPVRSFNNSLWIFGLMLAGSCVILVGSGIYVGWILLGRETREISNISKSAERIAYGNLSERISPTKSGTELAELVGVLNNTFRRLETSFDQQVRFTADASHELRTPLTAILTRCQLTLSKERSPEKYKESISSCLDAAQHMRKMVESLLELSRIDSGETSLVIQKTRLSDIVTDSLELLSAIAEKKFIQFETSLDRFTLEADASRIQQVCINLIANAIKFSPPGSSIHITVSKTDSTALFVVADEGPGLPDDELPNVFNRFFRGNQGNGRNEDSTGLGLAVARAIVVAHHGSIQASNRSSGGALFRMEIPLKPEGKSTSTTDSRQSPVN